MSYRSDQRKYDQYAFLRWWCQNQWWVQIAIPGLICVGVIGALMYQWNSERQQQIDDDLVNVQYKHWKEHPPVIDPELDEKAAVWRIIRMKKNDPSMPIPYKKKQLIVKHWKEIIIDMKAEEIQRLHDLLQDKPVSPTEDISLDIRKFDAPWKDEVSIDDTDEKQEDSDKAKEDGETTKVAPMEEDMPPATEEKASDTPAENSANPVPETTNNLSLPTDAQPAESTPLLLQDINSTPSETTPDNTESVPIVVPATDTSSVSIPDSEPDNQVTDSSVPDMIGPIGEN